MGNSISNLKKSLESTFDTSQKNVCTLFARGDNSYGNITNLNRSDLHIVKLWYSNFQCFALDVNGNLMSWGLNDYYQIGNGTRIDYLFNKNEKQSLDSFSYLYYETNSYIPKMLSNSIHFPFSGLQVKKVECGDGYSLFLLKTGELFSVGRNDKGQLGINLPFEKATIVSGKKCLSNVERVNIVDFNNNQVKIKNVITCSDFSFACDEYNNYYSWGNNDHFQLCRETINLSTPNPEKVETFSSLSIISSMKLGWMHGCILTNDNKIYLWGNPYYDYNNDFQDMKKPTEITELPSNNITQIDSGFHHIAFISIKDRKYQLYTFGANDFGQLGYETREDYIESPRKVILSDNVEGSVITEVITGAFHTMCKMSSGNIWGFGQNDNGQVGDYVNEYITWPTLFNWHTDKDLILDQIICANASTVIIKKRDFGDISHKANEDDENEEVSLKINNI